MREIKFKFYEKKGNSYELKPSEDYFVDSEGRIYHIYRLPSPPWRSETFVNAYISDNSIDMIAVQYTGLKDKNGKEIYEGDVVYISGFGNYQVKHIGADYDTLVNAIIENDMGQIVGDIYRNPELLKEEKND